MSKLREELECAVATLEEICDAFKNGTEGPSMREVNDVISEAKSALVDPVKKDEAKWKLGAEYEYAYCSHCGHQQWASWDSSREAEKSIGEFHKIYKFCPNCGFKMIGATDER